MLEAVEEGSEDGLVCRWAGTASPSLALQCCCSVVSGGVEREDSRRCLPSVVLAGTQKGGTTVLHALLSLHPNVSVVSGKESHFLDKTAHRFGLGSLFSRLPRFAPAKEKKKEGGGGNGGGNGVGSSSLRGSANDGGGGGGDGGGGGNGVDDGVDVGFGNGMTSTPSLPAVETRVVLDSTPSYMLQAGAGRGIHAAFPFSRVLVVLRDPLERAVSEYKMKLRRIVAAEAAVSQESQEALVGVLRGCGVLSEGGQVMRSGGRAEGVEVCVREALPGKLPKSLRRFVPQILQCSLDALRLASQEEESPVLALQHCLVREDVMPVSQAMRMEVVQTAACLSRCREAEIGTQTPFRAPKASAPLPRGGSDIRQRMDEWAVNTTAIDLWRRAAQRVLARRGTAGAPGAAIANKALAAAGPMGRQAIQELAETLRREAGAAAAAVARHAPRRNAQTQPEMGEEEGGDVVEDFETLRGLEGFDTPFHMPRRLDSTSSLPSSRLHHQSSKAARVQAAAALVSKSPSSQALWGPSASRLDHYCMRSAGWERALHAASSIAESIEAEARQDNLFWAGITQRHMLQSTGAKLKPEQAIAPASFPQLHAVLQNFPKNSAETARFLQERNHHHNNHNHNNYNFYDYNSYYDTDNNNDTKPHVEDKGIRSNSHVRNLESSQHLFSEPPSSSLPSSPPSSPPSSSSSSSRLPGLLFRWGSPGCWPTGLTSNIAYGFLIRSLYLEQLSELRATLGADRVAVLWAEDLRERPGVVLDHVAAFLGLPPFPEEAIATASDPDAIAALLGTLVPNFEENGWRLAADQAAAAADTGTRIGSEESSQIGALAGDLSAKETQLLRDFLQPFSDALQSWLRETGMQLLQDVPKQGNNT